MYFRFRGIIEISPGRHERDTHTGADRVSNQLAVVAVKCLGRDQEPNTGIVVNVYSVSKYCCNLAGAAFDRLHNAL